MTEATDRAQDVQAAASAPAAAPSGPDEAPRPYSSVSFLAIGGFALAIGYGVVITTGALVALFYRMPWVLPVWSLAFPLAAVAVCWAARSRIANSEGTLTGLKLTSWGLYLSFGFGVVYGAYYAACYLSVTQMAQGFVDDWLEDLRKDELEKAFRLTVPPPRPSDDANLRTRLELEFDRGAQGRGKFTEFRQSQLVRQFEQGGGAQIQFLGVQGWSYETGGYKVQLAYRVTTPIVNTEFVVTAFGVENADDSGERQWFVKESSPRSQPVLTAEGVRLSVLNDRAQRFAQRWVKKVEHWDWEDAYLDTLPPAERERQNKKEGKDFNEGLAKFRAGGVVVADPKVFWTAEKDRDAKDGIAARVRSMFGHGGDNPEKWTLENSLPTYHWDAEQLHFGMDVSIPLPPDILVQAHLVVAGDAHNTDPGPNDWRIDSLDLISGKSANSGRMEPPGRSMPRPLGPQAK